MTYKFQILTEIVSNNHVVNLKLYISVWSEKDLVAQAVVFFIAGFETISTGMTFLMYEMGRNPDIQERLVQEIMETDKKNGGKLDFDSIQKMVYLDMVITGINEIEICHRMSRVPDKWTTFWNL